MTICFLFCSATGVLKGFDALLNIVLDNTTEYLRGKGNTKKTGLSFSQAFAPQPETCGCFFTMVCSATLLFQSSFQLAINALVARVKIYF